MLSTLQDRAENRIGSFPQITFDILSEYSIRVPSFFEQKKIASILSTLDSKIELNNKINAELEAIAKTIYDYWFVQFDFPISKEQAKAMGKPKLEGKPYKSSGGSMVWNEELKREIPEGWGANNINRIGDLLGGGTPKTDNLEYWDGSIPFFTPSDTSGNYFSINTEKYISIEGLNNCSSDLFSKGTIFITARGTVGKLNIASKEMAMNQSCYAIKPKEGINYYYLHQSCISLVQYLKAKANGSIFDAIVSNDIKLTLIPIPSSDMIRMYGERVEAVYESILNRLKENQELASLRDWLLPMLMNGQVKVGNGD